MYVFNQGVSLDFYGDFSELVGKSTLHSKPGTITLFRDAATGEAYAAFTPPEPNAPARPVGRGSSPSRLFVQVLAAIEPHPVASTVPDGMRHPGPGRWWWLCFCDSFKPEGQQFLGVAVVEGRTLRDAIERTQALGINPGGRVASVACTLFVPGTAWRDRLLSRDEVLAAGNSMEEVA
jgi:hypothetical protein